MTQPTEEPEDPDLAQIVEQLDRIEATLDNIQTVLAQQAEEDPPT